jgi:hypothetical protein
MAVLMTFPRRYLVRFGPKQAPHVFTDLLVIGGGMAGLRADLEAPPDNGRSAWRLIATTPVPTPSP